MGWGNRVSKGGRHRLAGTAQALIPGPEAGVPGLGAVPGWPGHCRGWGQKPPGGHLGSEMGLLGLWWGCRRDSDTWGEGGLHRRFPRAELTAPSHEAGGWGPLVARACPHRGQTGSRAPPREPRPEVLAGETH